MVSQSFLDLDVDGDFRDLIHPFVVWHVEAVLGRDVPTQETSTDKVSPALVVSHARFGGRQTDEVLGHEVVTHLVAAGRWTSGDVPTGRDVDRQDRTRRVDDGGEDGVERSSDRRVETEPEKCVDDQVRGSQSRSKFFRRGEEWNV